MSNLLCFWKVSSIIWNVQLQLRGTLALRLQSKHEEKKEKVGGRKSEGIVKSVKRTLVWVEAPLYWDWSDQPLAYLNLTKL